MCTHVKCEECQECHIYNCPDKQPLCFTPAQDVQCDWCGQWFETLEALNAHRKEARA